MSFRTEIKLKNQDNKIDYKSKLLLFGSCFSNNIGDKLTHYKFNTTVNPFGIIFQPKAIEKLVLKCLNDTPFTENDLIYHNEQWHCLDVHSVFSNAKKEVVLKQLNTVLKQTKANLLKSTHLIITLGTAWVYRYIIQNFYVANCHKIPQKEFEKELLSVDQITASLQNIINKIKEVNPNCTVIFTLSPIRHLKDGFTQNQLSKAHLLTAIHSVVEKNRTVYFPAYEIMLDDLRDYRFYKDDLLHPNKTAITYIWNKFTAIWMDSSTLKIMVKIQEIQSGISHRPFNITSKKHQLFLKKIAEKKAILKQEFGIVF